MSELSLTFAEPKIGHCQCCGGRTTTLTRVVERDGAPRALYYATFTESPHPDARVEAVVSIGEFGQGSGPGDRAAFALSMQHTDEGVRIQVDDATNGPWRDVALLGAKLSRREASEHPDLAEVLEIGNHAVRHDASLFAFLSHGGGGCAGCKSSCALRGAGDGTQ